MEMQTFVNEFKGRVDRVGTQTQSALKSSQRASKEVFGVVTGNVQTLAKAQTDTVLGFYGTATDRFNTARKESIKSVIFVPVEILPEGRECVVNAYRNTQDHFVKTRDELVKVVREGMQNIRGSFGETEEKPQPSPRKTAQKTTTKTAKSNGAKRATSGTAKKGSRTASSKTTGKTASQGKTQARKTTSQARKTTSKAGSQAGKSASSTKSRSTRSTSQAKSQARKTARNATGTSNKTH